MHAFTPHTYAHMCTHRRTMASKPTFGVLPITDPALCLVLAHGLFETSDLTSQSDHVDSFPETSDSSDWHQASGSLLRCENPWENSSLW